MKAVVARMSKHGVSWVVRYLVWFYVVVLSWWGIESAFANGFTVFFEGDLLLCASFATILTLGHALGNYFFDKRLV